MTHAASPAISPPSPRPSSLLILVAVVAVSAAAFSAAAAPDVVRTGANPRLMTRGRFLASVVGRGEKGDACRAGDHGACSGRGGAAAGGGQLRCCGRTCTDVLASRSNCGACGARCPFGQLCCGGRCTAVAYDAENCGACRRACPAGLRCTYGMCGYA